MPIVQGYFHSDPAGTNAISYEFSRVVFRFWMFYTGVKKKMLFSILKEKLT
jgi:hypothetical protein